MACLCSCWRVKREASEMSGDSRKDFILATIGNFFSYSTSDGAISHIPDSRELNNFLDDGNCMVLALHPELTQGVKLIQVYNHVEVESTFDQWLVLFKLQPCTINPDNIHTNIFISSVLDSPIDTLYHSVQKVFAPILLKDAKWSKNLDPKIQLLIAELEAGLGSVLRHSGKAVSGGVEDSQSKENLHGILTPSDEFQYWAESGVSSSKLSSRERAQFFQEILQPLVTEFSNLDAQSFTDSLELIEVTQDALDDLWKQTDHKPPYPETRMKHLLGVISGSLGRYVQRKLANMDLWGGAFGHVRNSLQDGLGVCDKWNSTAEALTTQYWKQYIVHPWKGDPYVSLTLNQLIQRLEEVLSLRSLHEQLLLLLSPAEQQELNLSNSFSPFAGLQPLQHNSYTEPLWKAAVAQYERGVAPAELRIAGKLRGNFQQLEAQPHQLLREFQRYQELIKRPNISKELTTERETLLGQLAGYVRSIHDEFTSKSSSSMDLFQGAPPTDPAQQAALEQRAPPTGKNMPMVVNNIVWTRQLESKVCDILSTAGTLLGNLSGFETFQHEANDVREELKSYQREQFDSWSRDTLASINRSTESLSLQTTGRLMELSHDDGKLHVHYSDKLVTLLREVRQLAAFGFTVPAKIQNTANTAQHFYRHGVILKQVAHFYNTIDQQMIPSQQAMMLEAAMAFEHIIKNPKIGARNIGSEGQVQITWDNPEQLEEYIGKLQSAADRLTSENRRLRKCHGILTEKTVQLMSVDLLRQQQRWKSTLMDMRHMMASLIQEGFNPNNMKSWRLHWDHQLYKALEHQYQMGLESLNENLPEIKIELVYRHQKLQYRPSLEEVRAKYYREMKKFICIPLHFRGIGEATSAATTIFPRLINRNASGFSVVYKKAEELFQRLNQAQTRFLDWVVLGAVNVEELVEQHCHEVADWERNFKALKARGRDVEKLPNVVRVDCITVSTLPVKATIDNHIQQLFDALLSHLRKSISSLLQTIDTFLSKSKDALSVRPQSVEEIGQVNQEHAKLAKEQPEVQPLFLEAEQKNRLLRSVAGGGVDELNTLKTRWDKFEIMMESHQLMIKDQMKVMSSKVESDVQAFNVEVDKFASRWHQLKPRDDIAIGGDKEATANAVTSLKERRAEFDELLSAANQLRTDCEHFKMSPPEFPALQELEADITKHEEMWSLYVEFSDGLEKLSQEDWISFSFAIKSDENK